MLLRSTDTRRARRSAFTLLEILVVAAIVTMLAGAGIYYFVNQLDDAKVNRAKLDCQGLAEQVQIFNTKHSSSGKELTVLTELTQDVDGMSKQVPPEKLVDPWGGQYQFEKLEDRIVVYTTYKGQKISNLDVK
jgi:prepilin-type N-terminal cleavage/methylation domain-containing protein